MSSGHTQTHVHMYVHVYACIHTHPLKLKKEHMTLPAAPCRTETKLKALNTLGKHFTTQLTRNPEVLNVGVTTPLGGLSSGPFTGVT